MRHKKGFHKKMKTFFAFMCTDIIAVLTQNWLQPYLAD